MMHLDEVRLSSCRGKQMSLLLPEPRNYIAFFKINVACTTLGETPGLALIKRARCILRRNKISGAVVIGLICSHFEPFWCVGGIWRFW